MAAQSGINWTDASFAPGSAAPGSARPATGAMRRRSTSAPAATSGHHLRNASAPRADTGDSLWPGRPRPHAPAFGVGSSPHTYLTSSTTRRRNPGGADFWDLTRDTPDLDWLVLTKRPDLAPRMLPAWWGDGPANIWLGGTVENMTEARRRIPHLLAVPAAVHWLSIEPLLDLSTFAPGSTGSTGPSSAARAAAVRAPCNRPGSARSATNARRPATAFWMKQTGSNRAPWPGASGKGEELHDLPPDLRIRELPIGAGGRDLGLFG